MRRGFMKIAVCGRGRVGGGLADLWEKAGHQVTRLGHEGGDVSHADVVLLAVPGAAVPEALDKLRGSEGKVLIDATNRVGVEPPADFTSTAEYVGAMTGGPTAKSFNTNFARLYPRLAEARVRPSNLWCGDDECRPTVELLI
jgi:predicted dinucleotide-binding enzyme